MKCLNRPTISLKMPSQINFKKNKVQLCVEPCILEAKTKSRMSWKTYSKTLKCLIKERLIINGEQLNLSMQEKRCKLWLARQNYQVVSLISMLKRSTISVQIRLSRQHHPFFLTQKKNKASTIPALNFNLMAKVLRAKNLSVK